MAKNRIKKLTVGDKDFVFSPRTRGTENHKSNKRRMDIIAAGELYERWKLEFSQTPCKPWNVAGRVLALRDSIIKTCKNRKVRAMFREMIDHAFKQVVEKYGTVDNPKIPPPEEGQADSNSPINL